MQHHLWYMTLDDKLFLAPIKENPQHVLDIGTGTGIWAIDFGEYCDGLNLLVLTIISNQTPLSERHWQRSESYPTRIVCQALSPQQSQSNNGSVPVNCQFEVEDVEDEWTYNQRFDLIHGRLLVSCFKDPRHVLEQAFHNLAPGGYLEMQDADFPMRAVDNSMEGTALWEWNMCIVDGAAKAGRPWTRVKEYKGWMEEIGFVDVQEELLRWPVNTWPRDPHLKKLGLWFQHDLLEGLNSTRAVLTRGLGWSDEKVEVFLVDVRKDIKNRGVHAYAVM